MIKIIGVGDIMPGGLLTDKLEGCANEDILRVLLEGDIRCGTLECALGNEPSYDPAKVADRGNVIYAKDADIRRLKEMHIDIVSLANNHFFDLGVDGARHTIELLDKEGILHCGAGQNLEEAGTPVVVDIHDKKVAFLGFCDTDYNHVYMCTYATEDSPGINPMQEDYVVREIKKNVSLYDYVVVLAHWGTEHTFYPNMSSVRMTNLMFDAGAIAVFGSHPHRVQPVINSRKGSVAYSMGNFLFPERLIAPPKVTYYPDSPIDCSSLPITYEYPVVDRITLKTLPFLPRVGMLVRTKIEGRTAESDCIFSYLNESNCIELLEHNRVEEIKSSLRRIELPLKLNCYGLFSFARRCSRSLSIRLSRLFHLFRKQAC